MKKLLALFLFALVVAACGGTAADSSTTTTSSTLPRIGGRVSVGAPISVEDALASDGSAPVLVSGYLFVLEDGTVLLADLILESFPPQPGGATIVVHGFSVEGMALEQTDAGSGLALVKWTEVPYEILGTIDGGVLVYYDNPNA
jgi:hypothetical protein